MAAKHRRKTQPAQPAEKEGLLSLEIILPILTYKAFIFGFIFLSLTLLPPLFNVNGYNKNFHWPSDAPPSLATMFASWDAQMHLQLSHEGYDKNLMSVNHQPLWPLLIKIFSYLTLGNHLIAGLVLSNLLSVIGFSLFHRLARDDCGERVANIALALMLAFPGAIFFSFVYTESLFLLLSVFFIVSLKRSNYLAASVTAFFLPLTRLIGVFCVFPFAWQIFSRRESATKWFYCVSPLMGLIAYFLIMYFFTGDPMAGIDGAQRYVSEASMSKLFDVRSFVGNLFSTVRFSHNVTNSVFDRLWFVWFVLMLYPTVKINSTYFVYALFMGLVPAMTSSFMSYTRYMAIVFPLFLATASIFSKIQPDYWLWLVIAVLFSIQIIFLIRHVNFFWVA
jgi:hypothetical protein